MESRKRSDRGENSVRYAVVGLGWMAQEAVLPAFAGADHSSLGALVSSDADKLQVLGDRYGVDRLHDYDGYEECLASGDVDAVYIALPNHLHREYAVRAARAGVHILCEKPMALDEDECREMIEAAESAGVRLMIAYRLHFDPANLRAAEIARSGTIGEPRYFSSAFSVPVRDPSDIRLDPATGGGTLFDIGIYCVNAARYLFRDEPTEVWCRGRGGNGGRFQEVHAATVSVLGFPGDRTAAFTCSFDAAPVDAYRLLGTEGQVELDPAYDLNAEYHLRLQANGSERGESFPATDQVAPQLAHFSRCIREDRPPAPGGREGLADVRIIRALERSMRTGCVEEMEPLDVVVRPTPDQALERPLQDSPELVKASSPGET